MCLGHRDSNQQHSCVKEEVDVLGSPSITVLVVSENVNPADIDKGTLSRRGTYSFSLNHFSTNMLTHTPVNIWQVCLITLYVNNISTIKMYDGGK